MANELKNRKAAIKYLIKNQSILTEEDLTSMSDLALFDMVERVMFILQIEKDAEA